MATGVPQTEPLNVADARQQLRASPPLTFQRRKMMARFEDEIFREKTILVDGNQYINCTFQSCEILFGGYDPPAMPNAVFESCHFGLTGRAEITKNWLRFISGAGGSKLILALIGLAESDEDPDRDEF